MSLRRETTASLGSSSDDDKKEKKPRKLIPWNRILKMHMKKPGISQEVFNNNTYRDESFERIFADLEPDKMSEIRDLIVEEFTKDEVDLSSENIRGFAASTVGSCLRRSKCKELDLSGNFIRDEDVSELVRHLHKKKVNLKVLILANNRIGIPGAKQIGKILEYNQSLTDLVLDTNAITGSGIETLAHSLTKNKTLTRFSANWNSLDIYAEEFYFTLLKNRSLITLQLGYCDLNDSVAEALADGVRENGVLEELFLFGNKITDDGASWLADAIEVNGALRYLNLNNNLVTDLSAIRFIELTRDKRQSNFELVVNLETNELITHRMKQSLRRIRDVQLRKRTEFFSEFPDAKTDESRENRHDTLNEFVNNKFYNFAHDQSSTSSYYTDDSEDEAPGDIDMSEGGTSDPKPPAKKL